MLDAALAILAVSCASAAIVADLRGRRDLYHVLKPLTTLLILAIAVVDRDPPTAAYRALFVGGLAASLAGDVLLMLPDRYFAAGLGAFLVAHVLYVLGMRSTGTPLAPPITSLVFCAYAVAFFVHLRPHAGRLWPAILVYALVITGMAWVAFSTAVSGVAPGRWLAFGGALLFVASDSLLAQNRFVRPLRREPLLVLGTYYAAQLLLALSV